MPAIQTKDFNKTASSGPYAGETRDNIFELKIKDKKDFVLGVKSKNSFKKILTGISHLQRQVLLPTLETLLIKQVVIGKTYLKESKKVLVEELI